MKLESMNNPLYALDKSKIGKIMGGYIVTSGGGSVTFGAQTASPTTVSYSSDSTRFNDVTFEEEGKSYHKCENGDDPNCQQA